jgi:subtilisin family serine protease
MKKFLVTSLAAILNVAAFSQTSIWATVDNIEKVKESNEFQSSIISLQTDLVFAKAFTASKHASLQNVYEFKCTCNETELYTALHKVPGLSGIEYAPKYETLELPNDYTTSFTNNWPLDLIGASAAWDITTGDTSIVIAISDQNYYVEHEELTGKVTHYDNTNTSTRTHGTAVATTTAGNTNNALGIAAIGYNSKLGLYRMNYNDALVASYAGAKVINMSWTSGCSFNQYAQTAIDEIWNNGTFIVASAGNGTTCGGANNLVYPAAYNHVFAVTSVGPQDNIERTIGNPLTRHQTNSSVDICAPGHNVPITSAPGWYLTNSGTSFAAPYVTGTIGLMLATNPNLNNNEIDSILRLSATNIDLLNPTYIGKIGSGRLNSAAAVRIANQMNIIEDDGNNGHGNDEDGVDDSNPGNGNGNNGHGNGRNKPSKKSFNAADYQIYDMNGKQVNIEYAPAGMYLVVSNGIAITKIVK